MPEGSECRRPEASGWGTSVTALVTRFALRSRADKQAYDEGTRLAEVGSVRFVNAGEFDVSAVVRDGSSSFDVSLAAQGDALVGGCTCSARRAVCRHAVALAHAIWLASAEAFTAAPPPRRSGPDSVVDC